ncbi:hypothetical protein A2U01_0036534 [Trifolium medium]|uniref:Uncharacterized protein n=1 Tax=Trifolium medium TaxID=97028 RepID=A0A392PVQ5_9FABA|nr:hypothetical protein [Trifolium medium]
MLSLWICKMKNEIFDGFEFKPVAENSGLCVLARRVMILARRKSSLSLANSRQMSVLILACFHQDSPSLARRGS